MQGALDAKPDHGFKGDIPSMWYGAQPAGRVRPDADGVLRLRLVGSPPPADSAAARLPAQPAVDTLTVAFPLSSTALRDIGSVTVTGGTNAISLGV